MQSIEHLPWLQTCILQMCEEDLMHRLQCWARDCMHLACELEAAALYMIQLASMLERKNNALTAGLLHWQPVARGKTVDLQQLNPVAKSVTKAARQHEVTLEVNHDDGSLVERQVIVIGLCFDWDWYAAVMAIGLRYRAKELCSSLQKMC